MTILTYHAVDPGWRVPLSVSPATFEQQIAWLAGRRGFVPLDDVAGNGTGDRGAAVAVTFDDGFASVYEHAMPILQRYEVPAAVFLIGRTFHDPNVDWVDRPPAFPLRVLDRGQVREMRDARVSFGSHSYSHADLTTLGYAACLADLRRSREVLEDVLAHEVRFLAYPRGRHNADVRRAAARAGFTHAFGMSVPAREHGPYAVPRVGIYPTDRPATLSFKTHPWYGSMRASGAYAHVRPLLSFGRSR
jgi:peptidoglycan/xylan/chitin deacetylase (PgdA/CDA1 family)